MSSTGNAGAFIVATEVGRERARFATLRDALIFRYARRVVGNPGGVSRPSWRYPTVFIGEPPDDEGGSYGPWHAAGLLGDQKPKVYGPGGPHETTTGALLTAPMDNLSVFAVTEEAAREMWGKIKAALLADDCKDFVRWL